ncbi:MAG: TspO/MBR family protein [Thermovirgaceae bacterium]
MTGNISSRAWSFFAFLGLSLGVGATGSLVTAGSVKTWYPMLVKPAWTPPSFVFAPVWTVLYVCMAVAAWRVWVKREKSDAKANGPLFLYFIQLALNFLWSILFFGLRAPIYAGVEILLLLSAVSLTFLSFRKIDAVAGWLMVPYVFWVAYASTLNIAIVFLNR